MSFETLILVFGVASVPPVPRCYASEANSPPQHVAPVIKPRRATHTDPTSSSCTSQRNKGDSLLAPVTHFVRTLVLPGPPSAAFDGGSSCWSLFRRASGDILVIAGQLIC